MARSDEDEMRVGAGQQNDVGDEPVGYGRPPKTNQFKPGKSGNPKGRPKDRKSPSRILKDLLNERVHVQENGRRKRIPKLEALGRQTLNNAFKGDKRSLEILLTLMKHFGVEPEQEIPKDDLSTNEEEILANYLRYAASSSNGKTE